MVQRSKGLWEQCEAVRALHRYIARHGRQDLKTPCRRAYRFTGKISWTRSAAGSLPASRNGAPWRTDKGSDWKLDYHSVNMCLELMAG